MYYENKSSFYIRQYGFKILIIVLIILIAGAGLHIYINIKKKTPTVDLTKQTQEIENKQNATPSSEETEVTQNIASISLPEKLESLKPLEKKAVKITSVESNGEVIIIDGETRIKGKLIGLDFNFVEPDTIYQMGQDLINKQTEIAFDNTKCTDDTANVYLYLDNKLYNASLLENGKVKLDSNDINKLLLDELTASQAYAKQTKAGVWEK